MYSDGFLRSLSTTQSGRGTRHRSGVVLSSAAGVLLAMACSSHVEVRGAVPTVVKLYRNSDGSSSRGEALDAWLGQAANSPRRWIRRLPGPESQDQECARVVPGGWLPLGPGTVAEDGFSCLPETAGSGVFRGVGGQEVYTSWIARGVLFDGARVAWREPRGSQVAAWLRTDDVLVACENVSALGCLRGEGGAPAALTVLRNGRLVTRP